MWIIIILFVIIIVLWGIAKLLGIVNDNIMEQRNEQINNMKDKYFNDLKNACIQNKLTIPNKNILDKSEIFVAYNGNKHYAPGYQWDDGKNIVFCNDMINQCGRSFSENMLIIPFEDIIFYTKDGNITYTNEIVNAGKNVSLAGAIAGGLIAGDAGAIIGANKDANKIENITVEHDDVHTFVYYKVENERVKLADFKGKDFYSYILHLLPEKEYNYVSSHQLKQNETEYTSIKDTLKKLKDLYENDLIDESEYKNKKEQLLKEL